MKILLVDDDQMTLKTLSHYLTEEGYEVSQADNAYKAIEILQHEKTDLIISDIMMPNVSGLSFLSLLKNFYFDKIPVILISSLNKGDIISNSLGLGASFFLTKPIDFKELSSCVKKALEMDKV